MTVTLGQIVALLDGFYPPATALSWDRVGLVTGDPDQPIGHVRFAVDPTLAVIEEAIADGADLLVTHHPLLLRGIHSVATTTAKGRAVTRAVVADLAILCAHTNADVADPGVCDALAAACGLVDTEPLDIEQGQGVGRVGRLAQPTSLRAFAEGLAAALPPTNVGVRVSGDPDAQVCRVAVLGGSGDDRFGAARRSGVDVYVTADLRHHPALEAREESSFGPPYLIDAGHYATEWLWLSGAAARLSQALAEQGTTVETSISTLRTDPWDFLVGVNADGGTP
ncbi:MAG TPA: Nif3-like dinuclear metal center hexameric protein [Dermatophilaceae bacterium]|nr:Nif3-like dinuclear metal center hexameric protein [Dermatophilaceae bacterium]HOR16496.1 Nif3-like dinuclear metal center hexameric protein [Dermatophilaceae bacterium]HOV02529.1 Nif3-like dinuclear metal center hexameric protein [Dermatophilaceae bacterium]HPK88691.1 Nif3-like dinuclear metal center hexameric protein [Dermatophilaceae bacterium]HQH91815.1 Nif3-like dinuclear metal center hexameric protein [Dermatophilaceae bacterium]